MKRYDDFMQISLKIKNAVINHILKECFLFLQDNDERQFRHKEMD